MWQIRVESTFSARHAIRYASGEVEDPHDHTWHVEVRYAGADLDDHGLLVDFVQAKHTLDSVLSKLAGTDLNTNPVLAGRNPTAEHVAGVIYAELQRAGSRADNCVAVLVEEAPGCKACFIPDTNRRSPGREADGGR
ncbi:MAG: 6-carboxytetrahydropterin synthase [Planctomycetes bacterium]|nr:6-carboxytetrahydropterin synthase [Planctomycetota bacterium]